MSDQLTLPLAEVARNPIALRMQRCALFLGVAGPAIALAGIAPAYAQATSPTPTAQSASPVAAPSGPEAPGAGDIVVTATRRSVSAMKVPVALQAFTGETLAHSGVTDVQSLQVITPALVLTTTGAYAQPYIRGVGSRLLQNGFDPSVATYIDGRYISRQSAIVTDLNDVERVEVLKGPQGTLFGRNASGGAIRIITNEVSNKSEETVSGGYGNYNAWNLSGVVNDPLTDNLGIRIAGITDHHDGYAKNIVPTGRYEWNDKDFSAIRGKVRWRPGIIDANLTVAYWRQRDTSGDGDVALGDLPLDTGIARGGLTGVGVGQVATQVTQPNDKKEFSLELTLKADLGWGTLQSTSNYSKLNSSLGFDGDGTSAVLTDAIAYEHSRTISQELQLSLTAGHPLEWILGAYYYNDNTNFETTVNQGVRYISQGVQNVVTKSIAFYGDLTWHITDSLKLEGGGRFTRDIKDGVISPTLRPLVSAIGNVTYAAALDWNRFTPSATLSYTRGDSMIYAKYARGYKSGGFNYPMYNTPTVQPESLDMYELGLKSELFDRSLLLTMSSYYYNYKNVQVSRAAAASAVVTTQNAADAQLYGLDADATWRVTRQFHLTGSLAWEHTEYKDYSSATGWLYVGLLNGTATPGMANFPVMANGQPLLRAPKFSGSISANYDIPLGSGTVPINLTYAYKGAYNFDFVLSPSTSVLRQNAYGLLNGRIAYQPNGGRWEVAFWMNNILNKAYFEDVVAAAIGIRGSYGAPRTFGGNVTFHF